MLKVSHIFKEVAMINRLSNTNNLVNQHLVLVSALYSYLVFIDQKKRDLKALQQSLVYFIAKPRLQADIQAYEDFEQSLESLNNISRIVKLNKQSKAEILALKRRYRHIELMALLASHAGSGLEFLTAEKPTAMMFNRFILGVQTCSAHLAMSIKSTTTELPWHSSAPGLARSFHGTPNAPFIASLEQTKKQLHHSIIHHGIAGFKVGLYNTRYGKQRRDPLYRSAVEASMHVALIALSMTLNLVWLGYVDPVWLRMVIGFAMNIGEICLHYGMRTFMHGNLVEAHEANAQYHEQTQHTIFSVYDKVHADNQLTSTLDELKPLVQGSPMIGPPLAI
jgi:hypothetical protein